MTTPAGYSDEEIAEIRQESEPVPGTPAWTRWTSDRQWLATLDQRTRAQDDILAQVVALPDVEVTSSRRSGPPTVIRGAIWRAHVLALVAAACPISVPTRAQVARAMVDGYAMEYADEDTTVDESDLRVADKILALFAPGAEGG